MCLNLISVEDKSYLSYCLISYCNLKVTLEIFIVTLFADRKRVGAPIPGIFNLMKFR